MARVVKVEYTASAATKPRLTLYFDPVATAHTHAEVQNACEALWRRLAEEWGLPLDGVEVVAPDDGGDQTTEDPPLAPTAASGEGAEDTKPRNSSMYDALSTLGDAKDDQ